MAISILQPPQLQPHSSPLEDLPKTLFFCPFFETGSHATQAGPEMSCTTGLLCYQTTKQAIHQSNEQGRQKKKPQTNKQSRKKERQRGVPRLYLLSNPLNVQITLDPDKEKQQSNKQQEPSAAGERVFSSNTPENSVKKLCSPLSGYSYLKSKFHEGCRLNLISLGQTR